MQNNLIEALKKISEKTSQETKKWKTKKDIA